MSDDSHRRILLTVNGLQDPINKQENDGPILTLLRHRHDFDRIYLFHTTDGIVVDKVQETERIIEERYGIAVDLLPLDLRDPNSGIPDPTNYSRILAQLRYYTGRFDYAASSFTIFASPGTPEMHACLIMLVAGGEINAEIVQVPNPRFLSEGQPPITVIEHDAPDFPEIRPRDKLPAGLRSGIAPEAWKQALQAARMVGRNQRFQEVMQKAANAAPSSSTVLITGETGTGKEVIARFIHELSGRTGDFVPVNCSAITGTIFESELFGHVKGAFTGAIRDKKGFFEKGHEGTLFLDEVGELPLDQQAKFLRVLQEKEFTRVGDTRARKSDFRLIAATNRDLKAMLKEKTFREDLYFRLNVVNLDLPPLRHRKEDIPELARHILEEFKRRENRQVRLPAESKRMLLNYNWPGNIRELSNILERAYAQAAGDEILPETLEMAGEPPDILDMLPEPYEGFDWNGFKEQVHARIFTRALELAGGNNRKAGQLLSVSPESVRKFRTGGKGKGG